MIEIYLNNTRADVSKDTAIGLTKEPFNILNVPSTKITHTNKFKLPRTPANNLIFGFSAVAGNQSEVPYDQLTCKIISGFVIGRGYAVLESVDERYYNVTFYENTKAFVDLAGTTTINEVLNDILSSPIYVSLTFSDAISQLIAGVDGFRLPSQLQYATSGATDNIYMSRYDVNSGGYDRGCALWFEVDELIDSFCDDNGYTYTNNAAITQYFDTKRVTLDYYGVVPSEGYRINFERDLSDSDTYENYSVLDLIKAYAQKFNCFIDINEQAKTIALTPFVSLYATQDTSLNDKLVSYTKAFVISEYAQSNIVKFKPSEEASEADYYAIFSVDNENIDLSNDHLEINSLAPEYLYYSDYEESDYLIPPNTPIIPMMTIDGTDTFNYDVKLVRSSTTDTANKNLPKLKWYDSTAFFTDMEAPIFNKVVMFNAEVNLSALDYLNISPAKKYFFEALGGDFIVNKISGFNPSTNKPTKLQLIKIR